MLVLNSRKKTPNSYTNFSHWVSFWSNTIDVMAFGQNLKMLENWLYFWIPHPEISLDVYFQFYSSTITLLDIEFDPIFPVFDQIWLSDVIAGGRNPKNIRKLTDCIFWIPRLEINLDSDFQLFNSTITLLDIEFDPIFPVLNQTGGWNLKNIRKLTLSLGSPYCNECKYIFSIF